MWACFGCRTSVKLRMLASGIGKSSTRDGCVPQRCPLSFFCRSLVYPLVPLFVGVEEKWTLTACRKKLNVLDWMQMPSSLL